jgi:hypothetical protein
MAEIGIRQQSYIPGDYGMRFAINTITMRVFKQVQSIYFLVNQLLVIKRLKFFFTIQDIKNHDAVFHFFAALNIIHNFH